MERHHGQQVKGTADGGARSALSIAPEVVSNAVAVACFHNTLTLLPDLSLVVASLGSVITLRFSGSDDMSISFAPSALSNLTKHTPCPIRSQIFEHRWSLRGGSPGGSAQPAGRQRLHGILGRRRCRYELFSCCVDMIVLSKNPPAIHAASRGRVGASGRGLAEEGQSFVQRRRHHSLTNKKTSMSRTNNAARRRPGPACLFTTTFRSKLNATKR